ncbi:chemotaxis protein CheC [Indioceanicola profundi]|uniref:chemotaxis protein CheC n=1 Tax=Indioceanicola profundi TaxID=2220096 RepID=UPI00298E762B|nr:chemotaxis protein CheC [Indioceanicola profundi]
MELTDLERDALTELVNMGVGRAATSLSRLLDDQVLLSVPKVEILPILAAADLLSMREAAELVAIGQRFTGPFSGHALLIFPESRSFDLVRALMEVEAAPSIADIADIEQEALTEIGNIILNGCLAVIANTLRQGLKIALPTVLRGDGRRILLAEREPGADEMVLFLYIDFAVRSRNLNGYIALLMDIPSLTELRTLIREFIANLPGQDGSSK